MHGRPRKPARAEDAAAEAAKAAGLRDLQAQLLHNHHNRIYTEEAVTASAKLLEINPEIHTAWNYRKLALQHNLKENHDPEAVKSLVDVELKVVEVALRQNPKSYGAWYHRKWVLEHGFSSPNFDHEFHLLKRLLKLDARNFHGWNYRRFVAALKNVPAEEELNFTMDMINDNFSNYSAWHNRSVLLSKLLKQRAQGFVPREKILTEEYDLVRDALFVDPRDQSGWFYHLWLLDQTVTPDDPLLVSSWPPNGSDLLLSTHGDKGIYNLFSSMSSESYYVLHRGSFPIILYFNQAVKGVSSSTVKVNSNLVKDEDLVWMPLSTTNSEEAHSWVAYFKIPDSNCSAGEAYAVDIILDDSKNIISSRGSQYHNPVQLKFTIKLDFSNSKGIESKSFQELFEWEGDRIYPPQENRDVISIDQLRITNEHVPEDFKWNVNILSNEIAHFKESPEPNCKFVKLSLARLLIAYDALTSNETNVMHSGVVLKLFDDLIKLDPSHAKYYEDERSMVLMNQAILASKLTSSTLGQHLCLQLKKFSLTRIGFVEHLLWVKILDLSHNKLHSIAGLEALQLLTCLNLSNNCICSFTALAPLKLLSSLRVLNISSNEIGAHLIDTTRYLCSSPLSHTVDIDIEEVKEDDIKLVDYWEAILIFKGLGLTQIDVSGNAVADANFRVLLRKLLPLLAWMDGEHVR